MEGVLVTILVLNIGCRGAVSFLHVHIGPLSFEALCFTAVLLCFSYFCRSPSNYIIFAVFIWDCFIGIFVGIFMEFLWEFLRDFF